MSAGVILGNTLAVGVVDVTLSPASVAANTTAEQIVTVPGFRQRDVVLSINKPMTQPGLGIVNYRSAGFDQVAITFSNNTASAIVPTAGELYRISYLRPEAPATGIQH